MSGQRTPAGDRPDALLDAYRQAAALDDARPSPRVRDAVLAHARVVAQSAAAAASDGARSMPEALVTRPAANDRAWYWRAAAGLVLGIAGFWIYRAAMQPALDTQVASTPVPASASSAAPPAAESATAAPAEVNTAMAAPQAAAAPAAATVARSQPAETQIAVADGATAAKRDAHPSPAAARDNGALADAATANAARSRSDGETVVAKAKQEEPMLALAKPAAPAPIVPPPPAPMAAARAPQPFPASPPVTATAPAAAPAEDTVALAEMAKRSAVVGRAATAEPSAAADSAAGGGLRSERLEARAKIAAERPAMVAAAPAPAASASAGAAPQQAATPAPARIGDMTPPMQQGMANVALFSALRSGSVEGVRNAVARGANVNARDDQGRAPLQIARESNRVEIIRLLEAAGAK